MCIWVVSSYLIYKKKKILKTKQKKTLFDLVSFLQEIFLLCKSFEQHNMMTFPEWLLHLIELYNEECISRQVKKTVLIFFVFMCMLFI